MPRIIGRDPNAVPARGTDFEGDIRKKLDNDNKVDRREAGELVAGWGAKKYTPDQAAALRAAVGNTQSTFDIGAERVMNRFLNVTLPTLILRQPAGLPANSAKLAWDPPTTNTDGTPLTDLKGYKVYFGTAPGNYSRSMDISDPAATSFQVDNLPAGTWYFALKAVDTSGNESSFSNEASKTIP